MRVRRGYTAQRYLCLGVSPTVMIRTKAYQRRGLTDDVQSSGTCFIRCGPAAQSNKILLDRRSYLIKAVGAKPAVPTSYISFQVCHGNFRMSNPLQPIIHIGKY